MIRITHFAAFVLAAVMALVVMPVLADEAHLHIDHWPQTRTGQSMVALAPLRDTVSRYDARPGSKIVIRYPGGDLGSDWAAELRDWLVALGVPSSDLVVEPASGLPDTMVLQVMDGR